MFVLTYFLNASLKASLWLIANAYKLRIPFQLTRLFLETSSTLTLYV